MGSEKQNSSLLLAETTGGAVRNGERRVRNEGVQVWPTSSVENTPFLIPPQRPLQLLQDHKWFNRAPRSKPSEARFHFFLPPAAFYATQNTLTMTFNNKEKEKVTQKRKILQQKRFGALARRGTKQASNIFNVPGQLFAVL